MNWMIPAKIRNGDPDQMERATLIVSFARVLVLNAVPFPFLMWYLGSPAVGLYNLFVAVLIGLSPLLMRLQVSVTATAHVLIFLILGLMQGLNLFMDGILAPPVPLLSIGPMAAVFLLGRRGGIVWVVVALLCILQLTIFGALDLPLPYNPLSDDAMLVFRCGALFVLCIMALAFMLGFDSVKRNAMSMVQAGNQRLSKMIVHVEASGAALSNSAAEFLGSDGSDGTMKQIGLTGEMLIKATEGREMIEAFRESLRGMIDQYQAISHRIEDLYRNAANISELVKIIDNISDRLDLMALNTGIEAAHAGDAGKRFRLLADDMRRLAERVSFETTRIKAVIRKVQEHTDAAMESSTHGQSLTDAGTARVTSMAQAIDDIYGLIERTAEVSKRITQDMTNQIQAIRTLVNLSLQVNPDNPDDDG